MELNPIANKIYTYDDYLNFADDEIVEIIDGRILGMWPAPSRKHQEIITEILTEIKSYIKVNKGSCKVYPAPFDVVLKIVEVVSPYNPSNDYIKKLSLCQEYKVKEYWIVNPMKKTIFVYILKVSFYDSPTSYKFDNEIKVSIFENLTIDFKSLDIQ